MKPHYASTTLDKWAHLELAKPLTLSLPNVAKGKIRQKIPNFISKILKNKQHHVEVQVERFHLNGHITGFHGRRLKSFSYGYKTPLFTLEVKELTDSTILN